MTRLLIRIVTASGPRTIITHDLAAADTALVADALAAHGIAYTRSDAIPVALEVLVKRRRRAMAPKLAVVR